MVDPAMVALHYREWAIAIAVTGAFLWCVGTFFWRLLSGRMSMRDFHERHGWWFRLWWWSR